MSFFGTYNIVRAVWMCVFAGTWLSNQLIRFSPCCDSEEVMQGLF